MKLRMPSIERNGSSGADSDSAPSMPPPPKGPVTIAGSMPKLPIRNPAPAPSAAPAAPVKAPAGIAVPPRRRNTAVMAVGAALMLLAGAIAWSVASSFDDSIDVLVAARPLVEGEPVDADDFRTVSIAAEAGDIEAMSPETVAELVGRVAAGPIGEGSLIHPDQFVSATDMSTVVVGAALEPDEYPANGLKRGDIVRLIEVAEDFAGNRDDVGFSSGREIAVGEIVDVVPLETQDALHFSIRVGESAANVVADRISQDRLSLALVDSGAIAERVEPLEPAAPVVPLQIDDGGEDASTTDEGASE